MILLLDAALLGGITKWRSKYAGMDANLMSRLKALEAENTRLKKLYAESQLHTDILKECLAKK